MIANLKPYPKMKDSGVKWLGDVPEHWGVLPNRALFDEIKDRDCPDEQMLSVTIKKGVIRQTSLLEGTSKKDSSNLDRSNYKLVKPGDIAYNKMRAWQGAIGVSEHRGIISPAYVVERPRSLVDARYIHYLYRTPSFAKEAERWSYGITSDMWSLRPEHFKMIYGCIPPLSEQAVIVRFLDYMDRRVRRYIRTKQKLIGLLEEQKQAIIHRAVTRGLDPDVPLKPSGIEWLGDIPAHWGFKRLKQISTVQTGITLGKNYGDILLVERPYLRVANVQAGHLDLSKITTVKVPINEAHKSMLRSGDVLMTEGGDIDKLGRGCIWRGEIDECLHQNHIFAVRPNRHFLIPEYLVTIMGSSYGRCYFQVTAKQTTNLAATNSTTLGNFPMRLPDVNEQQIILEYITQKCHPQNITINRTHREIEFIREYRTRLIADVVTGKLDVRKVSASLPDEPDEIDFIDTADELMGNDEEMAEDLEALAEEAPA